MASQTPFTFIRVSTKTARPKVSLTVTNDAPVAKTLQVPIISPAGGPRTPRNRPLLGQALVPTISLV